MRFFSAFIFFLFLNCGLSAQTDSVAGPVLDRTIYCGTGLVKQRGTFYVAFGYNKDYYSKSTLHFFDESGDYDFKLHKMTARDRPHFNELFKVALSIPQYGYRAGYYFPGSPWGVEVNFDHAKYIVNDSQTVRLTGQIEGIQYDKDTLVTGADFMHLEHTDGANFLMANVLYKHQLLQSKHILVNAVGKAGIGLVIPRSDVTLWGERNNHCFHIAGQIAGVETGFRGEFFRYFFLEATVKGAYANFNKVLGVGDGLVSHRFFAGELLLHAGFQFPAGKR